MGESLTEGPFHACRNHCLREEVLVALNALLALKKGAKGWMNMSVHVWSHNKLGAPGFTFIAEPLLAICKNSPAVCDVVAATKSSLQITADCLVSEQWPYTGPPVAQEDT